MLYTRMPLDAPGAALSDASMAKRAISATQIHLAGIDSTQAQTQKEKRWIRSGNDFDGRPMADGQKCICANEGISIRSAGGILPINMQKCKRLSIQ